MMNRRKFIQLSTFGTGMAMLPACTPSKAIGGSIVGANAAVGHRLRGGQFPAATHRYQKDVVIIGGGVSGLSAARYLTQQGIQNIELLELDAHVGGNASFGSNSLSAFPWGAHYVPLPNNNLAEYLAFLQSCNVITSYNSAGLPVYNEEHLCFDPQERLYINGRWQDGLVPHFGLDNAERGQIKRFLDTMDAFRQMKGSDGKDAFAIPVGHSSADSELVQLDSLTMQQWMQQQHFTSEHLHSYVNYCCRDDFGTPHHQVSAWAGIHYFAARKGKGANAAHDDVLTWPEGNGFLVKALQAAVTGYIRLNALAIGIREEANGGVVVEYFDTVAQTVSAISARQCIIAAPQLVAARLLHNPQRIESVQHHIRYSPWMVANLTVDTLQERSGQPPSWDNVIFNSQSLGYVTATHQLLQQHTPRRNLTYYLPLTAGSPANERKAAYERTHQQWVQIILDDLRMVHPDIDEKVKEVNVMVWGHAMAQPLPGYIHGPVRRQLAASIGNAIHFAHTDVGGISIFEEAFYQGIGAAQQTLKNLPV